MEKRINKDKETLTKELIMKQQINKEEALAHQIFPLLLKQKTIYDAQTLLHGLSGYILHELEIRNDNTMIKDLPIDLSQEKDEFKDAFKAIVEMMKDNQAEPMAAFLKRFGDTLGYYGAKKYLENDTSMLIEEELIVRPKMK